MEELQVIETTSGRQFKPWATNDDLQAAVQDPASVTAITSEIASGKQAIASAINAKGGTASATESFSELAQAINDFPIISYGECTFSTPPLDFLDAMVKCVKLKSLSTNGNIIWWTLPETDIEIVDMPNVTALSTQSGFGGSVTCYQNIAKEIYLPNLQLYDTTWAFRYAGNLIIMDLLNFDGNFGNLGENSGNLIDLITGKLFSGNKSLRKWNATNAIRSDSSSLCYKSDMERYGRVFSNNREKWNYCLREHFAANLPDRTELTAYTITFGANKLAAMEQETIEAFTDKNWTLS